ncbi:MAG: hypothetical protein MUF31_02875 [Akkermansiaceae bacterium]|jgi:hypothetical protein|nr:hypothetical protein [Akkermansiaceae bacterium]
MQRGPLIAACATVAIAAGLAIFAANRQTTNDEDREDGISLNDSAAKGSQRKASPGSRDEGSDAQIAERSPTPADPLGVGRQPNIDRLLSTDQQTSLDKAIAEAAAQRKKDGHPNEADERRLAAYKDAEILREKLGSAIATNPDNWVSTYEALYSDYLARHHPNLAPGFGGDAGGDNGGNDGGSDNGGGNVDPNMPNLEEAARLRVIYDEQRARELPIREYVDPRFKPEP